MSLDLGSVIGRRYRLTRHIAAGGMGRVWEAQDDVLDRTVAVKVLHPQYSQDPEFVDRFRSEAKLTARVQHANVATVYDYGEMDDDSGHPLSYLVMEFVRGEALSDVLRRSPRLPQRHTLDMLEQTARALQAAHEMGLVHRDIKPGNIMITPSGQVKLTDFGIAKAMGEAAVTQTGMIIGTAHYIAPEQAVGKDAAPAGDVYSLAVVGYECLAGHRPFVGESPLAIAMSHVKDAPPPLPQDVPEPLRELISYGMAKEPERRYRDGGQFAVAVGEVKAGRRPTPPPGVTAHGSGADPQTRRIPGAAAAGAGALAGAGGAAAAAAAPGADRSRPETRSMPQPTGRAPLGYGAGAGLPAQRPPQRPPQHPTPQRRSGTGWIWALAVLLLLLALIAAVALYAARGGSNPSAPNTSTPESQSPTSEQQSEAPAPAPSTHAPSTRPPETETSTGLGNELSSLLSQFTQPEQPGQSGQPGQPGQPGTGNGESGNPGNPDNPGGRNPGNSDNPGNSGNGGTGNDTGNGAGTAPGPAAPGGPQAPAGAIPYDGLTPGG